MRIWRKLMDAIAGPNAIKKFAHQAITKYHDKWDIILAYMLRLWRDSVIFFSSFSQFMGINSEI